MSERTDTLIPLLKPYGLSADEAAVYLDLLAFSPASALEISRRVRMGRTKVYRILDRLLAMELVTQLFDERGLKFEGVHPEKLDQVLAMRESELQALRQGLPELARQLAQQTGYDQTETRVRYYSGAKGLERVNFNMLAARGGICSYEIETANAFMDHERAEYLRKRLVEERIFIKTLTNATHLKPFTQVTALVRDWWEMRHIPATVLPIEVEAFIYNEVFLVYQYREGDVFCVEMHNQEVAAMQRRLFELAWSQARVMEKIGDGGEVRIENQKLEAR